ncbi:MAG: Crp/Fnr family transcriptional regulator [Anaerolineales bacterium]|nr:Crp/Fnr family transcriptional regulator [Anaerolineales bacterium]
MGTFLPDLLAQSPFFSSLDAGQLGRLAEMTISRRYPAGGFLVHAGDCWPYLFLVVEGRLWILKESGEGRSLVIAELEPGELFWGLAFFREQMPNPIALKFHQPSELYLWRREAMLPFLLENGSLAWELSLLMMERMLRASEVIDGLAFQPVAGRLARLLMEFPGQTAPGPTTRSLTLDDMAARIGSSREVVCRFLHKFADEGLIQINRTEFEITDPERLGGMAQKEKI